MSRHLVPMAFMAALLASGVAAAASPCTPIAEERIGLQLYSLRKLVLSEPSDLRSQRLDELLAALARIGYRRIERFGGTLGLPVEQYAQSLRRHGVALAASHEVLSPKRWEAVLDEARALGQTHVGSGNFGAPGLQSLEKTLQTAATLNGFGQAAAAKGLRFYVHNHEQELTQTFPYDLNGDGKNEPVTAWEIIAANTDPRYVSFEVDVHWARLAFGLDRFDVLLNFLQRYRNRIELLHVKDTAPDGSIVDLGAGTTNWPAVFEAAGPAVRYYLWEHDDPAAPLQSAEHAYRFLRCEGQNR